MTRVATMLMCLALTGCVAAAAQPIEPGADFTLAPGELATIKGTSISVRFVAVTEDSRCPRDTTCIWAGEVKVQLEILEHGKPSKRSELKEGESVDAGGYRVTLVHVEPQPSSTARISAQDYRATLRVGNGESGALPQFVTGRTWKPNAIIKRVAARR